MVQDEATSVPEREKGKGVREEISDRAEAEAAMQHGLAAGMLKFRLSGHNLQGSFALIRTRGIGKKESWLLIKHADGYTQPGHDANTYDYSAVSGRSLAEIAEEPPAEV
jgi:bifunctional non-homologous end joining protein LigD